MALLPAEWAPQSAVMLTWPHNGTDWAPLLSRVEPVYVRIAHEVTRREHLLVVCRDETHRQHVSRLLSADGIAPGRLRLFVAPSNDSWARDHGPITVLATSGPRILDFRFNGWGNKFPADLDDAITEQLHAQGAFGALPRTGIDMVLEGGGIESDGQGTLMTTTHCQLSPQRNPQYDRAGLEKLFAEHLGSERVFWLSNGELAGDDTDSHIDTLARFCSADTIAYTSCNDPADEHYAPLQRMREELETFRDRGGNPYHLVALPLPAPKRDADGRRLPATYANFLIINGAVLVPTYDDPMDAIAIERLTTCFPDREVIGIDCLPLIEQNGSLHCITMQFPAGVVR